jgi:hypothetical protein
MENERFAFDVKTPFLEIMAPSDGFGGSSREQKGSRSAQPQQEKELELGPSYTKQ